MNIGDRSLLALAAGSGGLSRVSDAFLYGKSTSFIGCDDAASWPYVVHRPYVSVPHLYVNCAITSAGRRDVVPRIVGPNFRLAFCAFAQWRSHASEELLFRKSDHVVSGFIRSLRTLNGTSRQNEANNYRPESGAHDSPQATTSSNNTNMSAMQDRTELKSGGGGGQPL